jgi:tRNA A-37 threonylcarbamoyl transferase component Bud32
VQRLEEGGQLGRYQILKRLGAGAMGEVFLAEDPQIGRRVALKTVRVEEGRAKEIEERKMRLLREARAAGRLLHPSIVTLFDAGEDGEILYLAFEFVEGRDLAERVEEGPQLSLGEVLAIVRQAADGLDYAHRQGVVHRDIKPSNLMITADGRVKIADFGIARVADQTSDLTMTGSVVGSPHYMSPEQIRGDPLDGRTDIFSLGVLFYEILCHRRPFEGETLTTLVYQILNQDPTPLVVRRPDLGPRLEQLVMKMLHKDRDQRFATAADVVREIAACERELSPTMLAGAAMPEDVAEGATTLMPGSAATAATAATTARPAASPPTGAVVAPPPPPPGAPAPAVPQTAGQAAAAAPKSRFVLVAVIVVGVLAVLIVGGLAARSFVGHWLAKRAEAQLAAAAEKAAETTAEPTAPATTTPGSMAAEPASGQTTPAGASAEPSTPSSSASSEPASGLEPGTRVSVPQPAPTETHPTPVETRPAPTETQSPKPAETEPETRPVRPRPRPEETSHPATVPPPQTRVEESPAEPPPDPRAMREAVIERLPVDREMSTAMNLSFDVQPKAAAERLIVRLDKIVIGPPADWNAGKRGGRSYGVPDPGLHIVSFLLDGNEIYRIRINAQAGGAPNPTTISVSLPQAGGRRRP